MVIGDISLTPRAKKVIELAVEEARALNHNYIGTEHLLLGLVREEKGIAAQVLTDAGVNLELISTSEIRISVVCRDTDVDIAVRAVHDAFDLGTEEAQAVVYGGTGR